jgi:hypothetical protein
MNPARIFSLASRVAAIFGGQWPKNLPKGDAGLYVICRELAAKLEQSNPGMAESLGYGSTSTTSSEAFERITSL